MRRIFFLFLSLALLAGCASAARHRSLTQDDTQDRITVGKVQREIKIGMSSAQVAQVLGSPNIVSTDEQRREVWVYDKVATDVSYSKSEAGASLILFGGAGASGAASSTQRTLTIIIKFDNAGMVRDFSYHSSKF
ncbi:MAG: outer membrane protein assembly factor BamE [Candidatus Omnitrophica bacterium]|nr:outer membrane protein assembly factor BamE [Candidatus Omnitrophota bacterium]